MLVSGGTLHHATNGKNEGLKLAETYKTFKTLQTFVHPRVILRGILFLYSHVTIILYLLNVVAVVIILYTFYSNQYTLLAKMLLESCPYKNAKYIF